MVDDVMARYGCEQFQLLAEPSGFKLENLLLDHPLVNRQVPMILGEHVNTESGTGAVHTAPDHGVDDFNVGQQYGLRTLNLIDDHGVFGS